MKRTDIDGHLCLRALKCGWTVPAALRDEVVATLERILADPASTARDRTRAAVAIMTAHREERESIKLGLEANAQSRLADELAELRGMVEHADGDDPPRTGETPPAGPGPEGP